MSSARKKMHWFNNWYGPGELCNQHDQCNSCECILNIYLLSFFFQKNPLDFRPSQDSFNEKFFSYLNVDDIAKYLGTKCVFVDAGIYSGLSFL